MTQAPQPGWYPDPRGLPGHAWWTGTEWTFPDPAPAAPVVDKKAAKAAAKEAAKDERAAAYAEGLDQAGNLVVSEVFGGKTVAIYRNGYVRVAMFMRESVKFEKLIGIETSADITKKTGAGRAAGAVMTGGMNLLSSNKRGDVYLTVVTDENVYALRSSPALGAVGTAQKLAAAGSAVIRND